MFWDVNSVDEPFGTPPLGTEGPGRSRMEGRSRQAKEVRSHPGERTDIWGREEPRDGLMN